MSSERSEELCIICVMSPDDWKEESAAGQNPKDFEFRIRPSKHLYKYKIFSIIMGIQTEYNPDLALRDFGEFKKGNRKKEECIPENLTNGQIH